MMSLPDLNVFKRICILVHFSLKQHDHLCKFDEPVRPSAFATANVARV